MSGNKLYFGKVFSLLFVCLLAGDFLHYPKVLFFLIFTNNGTSFLKLQQVCHSTKNFLHFLLRPLTLYFREQAKFLWFFSFFNPFFSFSTYSPLPQFSFATSSTSFCPSDLPWLPFLPFFFLFFFSTFIKRIKKALDSGVSTFSLSHLLFAYGAR